MTGNQRGPKRVERSLVLGVSAGSANAVAVLAELAGGGAQVIGVGTAPCIGVRKGAVVDLNSTAAAMRQAADQACEMAGCTGVTRTVLGVSGAHIQSVVGAAEAPVYRPSAGVSPEDVRRVLDAAAQIQLPPGRQVVHVVPRSYSLDGSEGVLDPLWLAGRTLQAEAHLITGEILSVQNYLKAASLAGLEVVDYQVSIRAAGESVLTREELEAGVLLLDIGAATTGVAVYDRGHLWHVSVIPVGGEHITNDIAALLRVPLAVAEETKLARGWASAELSPDTRFELPTPSGAKVVEVEEKQLAQIIEPRVQEILELAALQVKRSGYTGLFPAGLVLTGGGSRLQGLVSVASDGLGLKARIGVPEQPLINQPEFATAAGLVSWGVRLAADEAAAAAEEAKRDNWGRFRTWLTGLFR